MNSTPGSFLTDASVKVVPSCASMWQGADGVICSHMQLLSIVYLLRSHLIFYSYFKDTSQLLTEENVRYFMLSWTLSSWSPHTVHLSAFNTGSVYSQWYSSVVWSALLWSQGLAVQFSIPGELDWRSSSWDHPEHVWLMWLCVLPSVWMLKASQSQRPTKRKDLLENPRKVTVRWNQLGNMQWFNY